MTDLDRLNSLLKTNKLPATWPGAMHSAMDGLDRKLGKDTRGSYSFASRHQYGNQVGRRISILEGLTTYNQNYSFWLGNPA